MVRRRGAGTSREGDRGGGTKGTTQPELFGERVGVTAASN